MIAFSATSSVSYERLINNCICTPTILKFKSEYEMVHGTSPVTDPSVVICADTPGYETAVLADLDKHYELHPVILVVDSESRGPFLKHIKASKFKYAEGGHQHVLADIRSWEYGVLLLTREEGRGVDTRFRKDAIVLIATEVSNYHELQQMVGRSSRTRGVYEGILYVTGQERPVQVVERLKRSSVSVLQDLEKLLILVEKRSKDQTLIKLLTEAREKGSHVKSLQEV